MNSNNPLEFVDYFDFPMKLYFRTKNFTKEALLADKRNYFKTWLKRTYSNLQTTVEASNEKPHEVKVKISFDYKLYNGQKRLKGQSNHLLTVIEKEGNPFISSVELWKK